MSAQKAKTYEMTPQRFGVLFNAVSMLNNVPKFRLHKVQACPGDRVAFSIVLTEVHNLGQVHPHDPAIVVGMSKNPEEAMALAIAKGQKLLAAINGTVDHHIFKRG